MSVSPSGNYLSCFLMNFPPALEQDICVDESCKFAHEDQKLGSGSYVIRQKPHWLCTTGKDPYAVYRISYYATQADLQKIIVAEHESIPFEASLKLEQIEANALGLTEIFRRGVYSSIPNFGVDNPFNNPEHKYYLIISVEAWAAIPAIALEQCKAKWMEFKEQQLDPGSIMSRWTGKPPVDAPPSYQWTMGFHDKAVIKDVMTKFSDFTVEEGFNIRAFKVVLTLKDPSEGNELSDSAVSENARSCVLL